MENKPKMYHSKEEKIFHNNQTVFNGTINNKSIIKPNDIRKKINTIINSNHFIYRKLVNIKINNAIIQKKIIGIIGNNLVTIDNEYIPIDNITDIYI